MALATVIDADTIVLTIDGERTSFRLAGMDAPELGQIATDYRGRRFDAGKATKQILENYLAEMQDEGWKVTILSPRDEVDRYRRRLARVELVRDGDPPIDVCEWMVREGWSVAEYGEQYVDAETEARIEGRGLWAGEFQRPKDYRREKRQRSRSAWGMRSRRRRSSGPNPWKILFQLFRAFK